MCVLYVSFGSTVSTRTFGCSAMGSSVLFILRSGVNRAQVALSGFSVLFCPGNNFMYVWLYLFLGCVMVMSYA